MKCYEIIESSTKSSLVARINRMIKEGWRPAGGVTLNTTGQFMQGVYKVPVPLDNHGYELEGPYGS